MNEIDKYNYIYSHDEYSFYGHSNHGHNACEFIKNTINPTSILDVGCGHNEFCLYFKGIGIHCLGLDFSCKSADIICDASKIPFLDKQFDLVTAFDVLEHILPDEVELTLNELKRVSYRYMFSISYAPSKILVCGENLHPTVRKQSWWENLLKKNGSVHRYNNYLYGNWII